MLPIHIIGSANANKISYYLHILFRCKCKYELVLFTITNEITNANKN
ncbi:hypothetical protein Paride_0303 [Pseudomonas phage Paride]|nr:hypothetical protein Paride_0303 [Pseudomonas phage Paride]